MNSKVNKDPLTDSAGVPLMEAVVSAEQEKRCRDLLAAMLHQALDDVKSWLARPLDGLRRHRAEDALRWIRRRRSLGWTGPVSFDTVCESIDHDADRIHGRIEMFVAALDSGSLASGPGADEELPSLDVEWHAVPSLGLLGTDEELIEKFKAGVVKQDVRGVKKEEEEEEEEEEKEEEEEEEEPV